MLSPQLFKLIPLLHCLIMNASDLIDLRLGFQYPRTHAV